MQIDHANAVPTERLRGPGIVQVAERGAELVALAGVLFMLGGALVVVVDVLLRATLGTAITALNEVMSAVFAIAVAATLPAGVLRGANLKVELLSAQIGGRTREILNCLDLSMIALLFAILTYKMVVLGLRFHAQSSRSLILALPHAPVVFAVAAFLAVTALLQIARVATAARTIAAAPPGRSSWLGRSVVVLALGGCLSLVAGALFAFDTLSGWVQVHGALALVASFLLLWLCILAQLHVGAVMGFVGMLGTAMFIGFDSATNVIARDVMDFLMNAQGATLPLFLMMGSFAYVAGISDDIYSVAHAALGRVRGGLAYATVAGCAGFGAVSGSSVATAATFGRIALPQMKQRNYSPRLAAGSVAAGGTLGALVPPSAPIILFAFLTEESIGALFIAAIVPALLALLLYFAAIFLSVRLVPGLAPPAERAPAEHLTAALRRSFPLVAIFVVVIGGLYSGFFTATESAAVGTFATFLVALLRGRLSPDRLVSVLIETTVTTAMIYGLIIGAVAFAFFVGVGQAADFAAQWIGSLDMSPVLIMVVLLILYLLLGSVMDSFAIMVITVPIVAPVILHLGYDNLHWGILMLVVVEIGMISPPFGMNLFVLKSIDPDSRLSDVMVGVVPFILADIVKIALLVAFPALALWLPGMMH